MTSLPQDLSVVFRRLRAAPGVSLLVVGTLGLVLGANTLTFSLVNEVVLNPLPAIADKDGLVNVHRWRNEKDGLLGFSHPAYLALAESDLFEGGLVAFNGRGLSLERRPGPEFVFGMLASANYFEALGVRPRLGRAFDARDNRPGAAGVVVLSDAIWRSRFDADPKVIGSTLRLNGRSFTVVGVGPARFAGHFVGFAADLWVPLTWAPQISGQADLMESRATEWLEVFGRLKSAAPGAAAAALSRINHGVPGMNVTSPAPERILVEPLTGIDRDLREPVAAFLTLLQGAAILVALIALVNVSSLLFARSMDRRQETAVRLALGASQGRLLTPFAVEAMVLCGVGSLVGLAFAFAGSRLAPGWLPPFAIPLRFELALDGRTFAFSALVALMGAVMATLGPGLAAARNQPSLTLRDGGPQRATRSWWRRGLVVAQVAFATIVLMSGSVLGRFLARAAVASPGFDLDRVQITRIDTSVLGAPPSEGRALQSRAMEAVKGLPGVESVAAARFAPYSFGTPNLDARDAAAGPAVPSINADWNAVSPAFFETLGISIARGRSLSDFDTSSAPPVVVINESLAARAFPESDATGRAIALGPLAEVATVVGVVKDVALRRLGEEPRPQIYRPLEQSPSPRISLFTRTANPIGATAAIRPALAAATPDLPLLESLPLRTFASFSQTGARLGSAAGLALGGLGLILAAVGLFGLVAQAAASRVREIAIRMAMGATSSQILALILGEGGRLGGTGLVLGLLGAAGLAPLLRTLVPDLLAFDAPAFLISALVVLVTTMVAIIGPAWRASRIAPQVALRSN